MAMSALRFTAFERSGEIWVTDADLRVAIDRRRSESGYRQTQIQSVLVKRSGENWATDADPIAACELHAPINKGPEKRMIVMSGDGIGKTNIVSSRSNSSGFGIGDSAALSWKPVPFRKASVGLRKTSGNTTPRTVPISFLSFLFTVF
ncbi:hypothetical protein QYF36_005311 [Acer negundo]|nr:hypothetical protein QYF36_005311 [Acer negundo]